MKNRIHTEGQILLITLLILTVATTIALSLIGRATLDLSMSNQLEESSRAFSAAEAGIEEALGTLAEGTFTRTLSAGVSFTANVNSIGGNPSEVYQFSHETAKDATETIWLVNHTGTALDLSAPFYTRDTIDLCWDTTAVPAAVAVNILYKDSLGAYKMARGAYDPDPASRDHTNNFEDLSGQPANGCGLSYYKKTIDFTTLGITPATDTIISMRIRPVYANTTFAVDGGILGIPQQGYVIESTGSTGSGVTRKVIVYKQYRAPLSVFDAVIYSQSGFGH